MILDAPFPPDQRVEKEAISLITAGHEVFLFCLDFQGVKNIQEVYKGIHVRRYRAGKLIYKLSALAYTFPFYRWLVAPKIADFIKENTIQVLHIHDMVIAESAFSANKKFKLPVVLDLHENRPEIMREYKHVNSFQGRLLIDLKRWKKTYYTLARRANAVVVVAELAKQDIITHTQKTEEQVVVVPNTISKNEFLNYPLAESVQKRMEGSYNLLYIGDTSLRRGTDLLIRAMVLLKNKIPDARLWIVGKSSVDAELKSLAVSLGVHDCVMFEGWKDVELLPSYIAYCNVALSPLKKNIHHDTTYANKIFQYMAMGKPVVVSDCITQAELVKQEHCGLVHTADDVHDLTDKIISLHQHPDRADQFGLNGVQAVHERWFWEHTVIGLQLLYERKFW